MGEYSDWDSFPTLRRCRAEKLALEAKLEAMERVAHFLLGIDSDTPNTDWQVMFKMAQDEARFALAVQQEQEDEVR